MKTNFFCRIFCPRLITMTLLTAIGLSLTSPAVAELRLAGLDLERSDTDLMVDGEPVRLHGISFPTEDGICGSGIDQCRSMAYELLDNWIKRPELVQCEVLATLTSGVHLSRCHYNGEELAAHLVNRGWAIADRRASRRYVRDEHEARHAERGLWGRQIQLVASLTDPI